MSVLRDNWRYRKMVRRRINLMRKKLNEIEDIKITYGTVPDMSALNILRLMIDHLEDSLMD